MLASTSDCVILQYWRDNELKVFSQFFTENKAKFTAMCWCHDNSYIGVIEENGRPLILSSKDRSNLHQVHTIQVISNANAMAFKHTTKRFMALATVDGDIAIYDTKLRILSTILPKLKGSVNFLQYNSNDQQLGILAEECLFIFSDINNSEFNNQFKHKSICTTMKFNPVLSNQVVVGCLDGNVTIWDTVANTKLKQYHKHSNKVTGVGVTGCGRTLVTCGVDYKICLIDNIIGNCVFRMNLHVPITSLDISSDDKFIATGLHDGSIYIYDIRNYIQPICKSKSHDSAVQLLAFENGPRDNFELEQTNTTAHASSISINDSELRAEIESFSTQHKEQHNIETVAAENSLDKIKKELSKCLKSHMEDLEHQLMEHCHKFQEFLNNEFEAVHDSIRDKWEIFGTSEASHTVHTGSGPNDTKSVRSNFSGKRK